MGHKKDPTYLAHSANLPTGLYILPSVFFFKLSKAVSGSTAPIFTLFSPNERYLCACCQSGPVFPIPQATLPWQPILCRSGLGAEVSQDPLDRFSQSLRRVVGIELQMISPTLSIDIRIFLQCSTSLESLVRRSH